MADPETATDHEKLLKLDAEASLARAELDQCYAKWEALSEELKEGV
jgi:hypothetical protein